MSDHKLDCTMLLKGPLYDFENLVKGKKIIDIGFGFGPNKELVKKAGGQWVGIERFGGGSETVFGDAQALPFAGGTFDIAIMDAVIEHFPDVGKAFGEASRVLKTGGVLVGYSAFMECYHEILYSHLSFKAIEHYSKINGLKLEKISAADAFGIDYHLDVIFYPLPFRFLRVPIRAFIKALLRIKSYIAYWGLRIGRKMGTKEAKDYAQLFYMIEIFRLTVGYNFLIRKVKENHSKS